MTVHNLIQLEEVLFVFQKWTLMYKSEFNSQINSGSNVELFDENQNKIGTGELGKLLSSRNPAISAIELEPKSNLDDFKLIKYIKIS